MATPAVAPVPSKTYADVAVEPAPTTHDTNGTRNEDKKDTSTSNGVDSSRATKGREGDDLKHTASVLRIVNTGAPESEGPERKQEEKPRFQRKESTHEYTAEGLDDMPRTPPRNKHRKQRSNGSPQDKSNAEESHSTANGDNARQSPVAKENKATAVFEKLGSGLNGSKLTSVKPSVEYENQLRTDQEDAPKPVKEEKLASGRKAGQRWETSAIRWAPMNVPLQRRLQTLVVLWHTLCIAICVSAFCFLCAIPLFWPLLIPYMIYCMSSKASTSGTLSHRSNFLRGLPVWSLFASYFPARLHRTQELPATRKYIFGYHPHGIISMGAFAAFGTEALGFSQLFPGIHNTLLTLDSNFRIPFYRDYALAMGIASVSKESCENLLSKGGPNKEGMGRAITIVVGGARESLDAQPRSLRLVLKRRKGFVKMAIRTGADLVPVLAFGENDIYEQLQVEEYPNVHKFQLLVKKLLGFTIPLFHARGVFNYDVGLMPYRRPINIVVGRPVKVLQANVPAQEDIDRVHEEYVTELERVWNTWKDDFAPGREEELVFVE